MASSLRYVPTVLRCGSNSGFLSLATRGFHASSQCANTKKSTKLTGLNVVEKPHHILETQYLKILKTLAQMPSTYKYRTHTEQLISERLSVVKKESSVEGLERAIAGGQAEELIIQARNELKLARRLIEVKAWEPLVAEAPKSQWKWPN